MEVHAHSHTPRKKWSHYFWEFIMLFLAVFCGFLAENQREHMVEHKREKQYMRALIIDLKADTISYNRGLRLKKERVSAIDSTFIFFNTNPAATSISGKTYKTLRRTSWDQSYNRHTITINQLKNAGAMRLIRNREVADSIISYDFQCSHFSALYGEYYVAHQSLDFRYMEKLVNASQLLPYYITNNSQGIIANIPDSLDLKVDGSELNQMLNFLMQVKVFTNQEINQVEGLKRKAGNLIARIKEGYHVE